VAAYVKVFRLDLGGNLLDQGIVKKDRRKKRPFSVYVVWQ
jgi:hypothetical protein